MVIVGLRCGWIELKFMPETPVMPPISGRPCLRYELGASSELINSYMA
jgi:hypothetical protein